MSPLDDSGRSTRGGQPLSKLWALNLATPNGSTLSLASLRGKPMLLNFWATWCPPCVEELPLIDRFYQENAKNGWQVLGLAVDQVPAVNNFLGKMPVKFPVAMAGMAGIELSKSLGNLSGGLPFTVVIGSQGAVLHRKMGRVSADDLNAWAALT
jgi:thiol-disulfide isomerase/thioredoxin